MREPIVGSIREGIRQSIVGSSGASSSFTSLLTSSLVPQYGGVTPTFTRATTATVEDFEGLIRYVKSGEARFKGARRVENLIVASEDMTNGAYSADTGVTVDSATQVSWDGTDNADFGQSITIADDGSGAGGRTFVFSIDIGLVSGTISSNAALQLRVAGDAIDIANLSIGDEVASTVQRYAITVDTDAAGTTVLPQIRWDDAGTLYVSKWQLEEVTGQANQNPSEYVSTGVGTGGELWESPTADADWTDEGGGVYSLDGTQASANDLYVTVERSGDYVVTWTQDRDGAGSVKAYSTSDTSQDLISGMVRTTTQVVYAGAGEEVGLRATSTYIGDVGPVTVKLADHGANRDGVKYFPYHNGNTVSGGVVTEATGPAINSRTSQWVELDGSVGSKVTTPDSSANSVLGDIFVAAWIAPDSWTPSPNQHWISKRDATDAAYVLLIQASGVIQAQWTEDGSTFVSPSPSSEATGFADGTGHWFGYSIDVDNGAGGYDLKYWVSDDHFSTAPSDVNWTQLGETRVGGSTTSIFDSGAPVVLGQNGLDGNLCSGKIARAAVIASTDPTATPVVDFNPNDYDAGETWENSTGITELFPNWTDLDQWSNNNLLSLTSEGGVVTAEFDPNTANSSLRVDLRGGAGIVGTNSEDYIIDVEYMHTGTGTPTAAAVLRTDSASGLNTSPQLDVSITTDDTDWKRITYRYTNSAADRWFGVRELNANNDGGVKLRNLSIKHAPYVWTLNGNAKVFGPKAQWADLDGESGTYVSTPDSPENSITGDSFGAVYLALDDWTPTSRQQIIAKYLTTGNQRSWGLSLNTNGTPYWATSTDGGSGTVTETSGTIPFGFSDGTPHWIGWANDVSESQLNIYISNDSPWTPYHKINWTLHESLTHSAASVFDGTAALNIGGQGGVGTFQGKVMRAAVIASTDPTAAPAVDFDARSFTPGVSTAVTPTGETWTANGNVTIGSNIPSKWDSKGPYGYLAEGARTNILLQSNSFDTTWTNVNSVDTANYAIAPDGTKTAWRLIDDSATGTGAVGLNQSLTLTTATDTTISFHFKADQLSWAAIRALNYDAADAYAFFDLANGVVGTVDSDFSDAGMESLGNGWYRCWGVFQTTTDVAGNVYAYAASADNAFPSDLDGTSSILVWGAQVEAGSFPSTYIPTEGSAVARNADVLTYSAAGVADSFPMTFSVDYAPKQVPAANSVIAEITDNSTSDRAALFHTTGNDARIAIVAASSTTAQIDSTSTLTLGSLNSITAAVATDDVELYVAGASTGTPDTSAAMPTGLIEVSVGAAFNGSSQPFGNIRNVKIFPKRLTDTEVSRL